MRILIGLGLLVALVAGCAEQEPSVTSTEIAAVSYQDEAGPYIAVVSMINNRSGAGGHSALIVNASERVMFDPAGSFRLDILTEKDDVIYGFTPRIEQAYRSAHARSTYHVVTQTIPVTAQQAEIAYRLVVANGPVAQVFCTQATSSLMQDIPGFDDIRTTFFPDNLMRQVDALPGVLTDKYFEDDDPDLDAAIARGIEG
jgi:hypothetical protein